MTHLGPETSSPTHLLLGNLWQKAVAGSTVAMTILTAYLLPACTPAQRGSALTGVAVSACGAGKALSAAGLDYGALVEAASCWIADWAAARQDRLRAAELAAKDGLEAAAAPRAVEELDELDQAALELTQAKARMVADPCEANAAALRSALDRCLAIETK